MNVSATDKSGGKTQKITISNNKGRLSPDEIERLVKEAEEMKGQDELAKKKVEAKNSLEQFAYSLKNTLRDEKYADKFSADDKSKLEQAINQTTAWIDANHDA